MRKQVQQSGGRVIFVQRAVSDKSGQQLTFYESELSVLSSLDKDWSQSSRFRHWNEAGTVKEYTVETVRLDHLIGQFGVPDLIKIDVENHEEAVLRGLSRRVPMLCFEYALECKDSIQRCVDRLKFLGFEQVHVQFEGAYIYEPDSWVPIDSFTTDMLRSATLGDESWGMVWAS
jgi:FkbM family methyltransferase